MQPTSEIVVPPTNRRIFYSVAILLLLAAITTAYIQKGYEQVAHKIKTRQTWLRICIEEQKEITPDLAAAADVDVQQIYTMARFWGIVSLVIAAMAVISRCIGVWRQENCRWVRGPYWVLFVFWVFLYVFVLV